MENKKIEKVLLEKIKTYLSYRAHSEYELQLKLKKFDEVAVEKAIKHARENNWLTKPEDLACRLAEQLHKKKKGWLFIQSTLKTKKLPMILKQEDLEEEKCRWWLAKKLSPKEKSSQNTIKKMYHFLIYRGFEGATAKKVIHEYFSRKGRP